jgi:hypothetical protein
MTNNLMKLAVFLISLILLSNCVFAYTSNLDHPKLLLKKNLGKSNFAEGGIIEYCYVYNDMAVIDSDDPGLMGSAKMTLRFKKDSHFSSRLLCTDKPSSEIINFDIVVDDKFFNGYFVGRYRNFLLINDADTFGHGRNFKILKIKSHRASVIYSNTAYDEKFIKFFKFNNGHVGIQYWKRSATSCSLADDKRQLCWKNLLKENNLKNVLMPDCTKKYLSGVPLNDPSMVFIKVQVPDVERPKEEHIISDSVICFPAP